MKEYYYIIMINAEPYDVPVQIAYRAFKWAEVLKAYPEAKLVRKAEATT